jgi:hypothetical protein
MPCAHLHLWGHGDDLAGFERLAAELKVDDRVFFNPRGFFSLIKHTFPFEYQDYNLQIAYLQSKHL